MYQHLENLNSSVKEYFPDNQHIILQKCAWIKDPLKAQNRPIVFIVTEYEKFIEVVSDSTLQPTFQELTLIKFLKNMRNCLEGALLK